MTVETKRCPACGEVKPHSEFQRDRRKRDGCQSRCKPCKAAQKRLSRQRHPMTAEQKTRASDRARRWYVENRDQAQERNRQQRQEPGFGERQREYNRTMYDKRIALRDQLQDVKEAMGCLFCEETQPYCLDLHHVDPREKKFAVSQGISSRSLRSIISEAAKCVVLCANCHRKVHYGIVLLPDDAPRLVLEMPTG